MSQRKVKKVRNPKALDNYGNEIQVGDVIVYSSKRPPSTSGIFKGMTQAVMVTARVREIVGGKVHVQATDWDGLVWTTTLTKPERCLIIETALGRPARTVMI